MKERNVLNIKKDVVIGQGSEAKIYRVSEGVYKEFIKDVNDDKRACKKRKLLYLEQLEHLKKYYPHIYYLVISSIQRRNIIDGYVMEDVIGYYLNEIEFSFEEKIVVLKLIRAILEEFNKEDIIYHDLRSPNIKMTPDRNIVFLDIDSVTTTEHPYLDVIPSQLEIYMMKGGKHGLNAQLAMFNKFTNAFLQDDYYQKRVVLDKEGMVLMKGLINAIPDSAFDHEYLYEHIKKI